MMEVPDRWSDVLLAGVPANPSGVSDARYPFFQDSTGGSTSGRGRSSLADLYLRRYVSLTNPNYINPVTNAPNRGEDITELSRRRMPVHDHHVGHGRRGGPLAVP